MSIKMIVATGFNFEIGVDNKLLWHLPEDMNYFKEQTEYFNVIMGNNTFTSLNLENGLSCRTNWVITKDVLMLYNLCNSKVKYTSIPAMQFILNYLGKHETFWIIGGAQIYEEFIDFVDEIHWTHIEKVYPEANKFLTDKTIDVMIKEFDKGTRIKKCYDEKSDTHFTINVLKRIK